MYDEPNIEGVYLGRMCGSHVELVRLSYRTCCLKQAWVKCKVRGLSRAVEKFSVDRYRKNAHKVPMRGGVDS